MIVKEIELGIGCMLYIGLFFVLECLVLLVLVYCWKKYMLFSCVLVWVGIV